MIIGIFIAFFVGGTVGAFSMAVLSATAYEKGYKDGRGGR